MMDPSRKLVVGPCVPYVRDGKFGFSAAVQLADYRSEVWFVASAPQVSDGTESMLAATLLPAMRQGATLELRGAVSPKLLGAVETIQDVWRLWDRTSRKVPVQTAPSSGAVAPSAVSRRSACFFSGGVDSFFSVLKHRANLDALILLHGFDMPLECLDLRAEVRTMAQRVAGELNLDLIEVETNVREFADAYAGWDLYHGSMLAAVALALAPSFGRVLIPSSHDYGDLAPLGSHPMLDPLWSTERLTIVHDGCECRRVEKVAMLAGHEVAMRNLRVCWSTKSSPYNCGKCEKCLRTVINLELVGARRRCTTFGGALDMGFIRRMRIESESTRAFVRENLEAAKALSGSQELADSLQDALDGLYHKGVWGWPRRIAQKVGRSLA